MKNEILPWLNDDRAKDVCLKFSPDQRPITISRRSLLSTSILVSAGLLLSNCSRGKLAQASSGFAYALSDLVIPATSTPGAVASGVPAFIERALSRGLFGGDATTLAVLEADLDQRAGTSFVSLPPTRQKAVLETLDREAFMDGAVLEGAAARWRHVKDAIITGYYTSEPGGSQELIYELAPGKWEPDIPLVPGAGYLSNNWMANLG